MKKGSIIIVDDNKNVLSALRILLNSQFEKVYCLSSPNTLLTHLREYNPDIVLLDMNYSAGINTGNEGLYWLSEIKKYDINIPVVLFTAYADIDLAVKALKKGASDFIVKPWDNTKLIKTLQSALSLSQTKNVKSDLDDKKDGAQSSSLLGKQFCWGESAIMQTLLSTIEKVALTDANILITGENGTGKDVIARMIHSLSKRKKETLIAVDMGAVTENLFESELFGHTKGSFTDAKTDREGKFEAANKGSLFLDEIGNLSYVLQAKLLTALQSRQVVRIGSNTPIPIDIRLICATNKDLFHEVNEGSFREDLFYRINTIHIEVPALRERKEDIPLFVEFFRDRFANKYDKKDLKISQESMAKLTAYSWPGNIRELEHAMEKAVILSDSNELSADDFYMRSVENKDPLSEATSIEEMEKVLIEKAIKRHSNNFSAIALELGITRPTLYSKIKKYGLS